MIEILKNHHFLLQQMVKKEMKQKYSGAVLGFFWMVAVPVLMLLIYTFVFSEVFGVKWDENTNNKYEFALMLFVGLAVFNALSDVMGRATFLISSNVSYVKKVVFPLEILSLSSTITALINSIVCIVLAFIANIFVGHGVSWTLYQAVVLFIPLFLLCDGVSLLISAISVYVKDMGNIVSVLTIIFMYMSPVFYSMGSISEKYRVVCRVSPLTYIIENFRNTVLYGRNINISYFLISMIWSIIIYMLGKGIFAKLKIGFADVV